MPRTQNRVQREVANIMESAVYRHTSLQATLELKGFEKNRKNGGRGLMYSKANLQQMRCFKLWKALPDT